MKNNSNLINRIDKNNLCLGCGLCESIFGSMCVKMETDKDGFIHPKQLESHLNKDNLKAIKNICPGINVRVETDFKSNEKIWGRIISCSSTYSTDSIVRQLGSSGGAISQICISLIELGEVDYILQVGSDPKDYSRNQLKLNNTKKDILECASSRYAPASIFNNIHEILSTTNGNFAFVGKPCDISALSNFLNYYPQFKKRFKLKLSIICAGIPSLNATRDVINQFCAKYPIKNLKYRGDGWPGFFTFWDSDDKKYSMSYNDSWGDILGKQVHYRCKICPDGIGLQADIAIGDAWITEGGYPDFTERPGQSLTITRTEKGEKIIQRLVDVGKLERSIIATNQLKLIQPYQYKRRIYVGARLLAFIIIKMRVLNYKKLAIISNALKSNKYIFFREFIGSIKRLIQ